MDFLGLVFKNFLGYNRVLVLSKGPPGYNSNFLGTFDDFKGEFKKKKLWIFGTINAIFLIFFLGLAKHGYK